MRIVLASILFAALGVGFPASALAADEPPAAPPPAPAPMVVAASPNCGCCPAPDPCRKRHFEIQGHLALLTPDPEGTVGLDSGPNPARWDDIDYEPEFGGRVLFTFPLSCWDMTIAGTWWGNWEGDATSVGTLSSTQTPGGQIGATPVNMLLHEEATLWDVNLTVTKPFYCSPCFTARWGFGVRWLHFEEEANFQFTPAAVVAVFPTVNVTSDIDNDLVAAELVAEGDWKLSGCWSVVARGSVFAGWMHREGEITATGLNPPPQGTTGEEDDIGFGGEVEVALVWHPSSCWSVSLGYGLLVMGNVTRAHESFDFQNLGAFDLGPVFSDDLLLVHRVFVGVGFNF